ncbi:hypothetical protein [Microbacterium dextranolyticum]|uniref:Uncharacterized protein n=1 Tax=Microbacterium dextranolyticum TaxID=36806 RepID=A0A9W6M506_9MICO|nr:hypothetical protein [Microbacterium dextranolyticum]MBM7462092.1 hypothetical protein [Microbacterium dextranolyticum]GLJ94336.1 hypothetical protein GCM10017591_03970 [Microbacterium dextranolyticum]
MIEKDTHACVPPSPLGDTPASSTRHRAGLSLDVAADGSSTVSFRNTGSAVFVNGIWINTGTDLYTGRDPSGTPRVLVHLNERVPQSDGSVVITALRYEDLTGAYPAVSLGTVRWKAPTSTPPTDGGGGTPSTPPQLPPRYAFAVSATGPSTIDPALVADRDGTTSTTAPTDVSDGDPGQIALTGAATASAATASTVSIDRLTLYPGTALEVSLRDVRLSVSPTATTLTTGGGTVGGQTLAAGPVAANTRVTVPGRSMTFTLNAQSEANGALTVVAVDASDSRGLGAHVRAGVVTADPPPTPVDPGPSDPDTGGSQPPSGGDHSGAQPRPASPAHCC